MARSLLSGIIRQQLLLVPQRHVERIGVLDMPVDQQAQHKHDDDDLDDHEGVGLRSVVVGLDKGTCT